MVNLMSREKLVFVLLLMFSTALSSITYEVVKVDSCRAVAYSSEKCQTDDDPFTTASGTRPKWGTVAANHLPFWTRIKIEGFGEKIFTVEDRLNRRHKKVIDIWFPTREQAVKFGVRKVKYWVLKNVRPFPN